MKNTRYEIETPYGFVDFDGIKQLPTKQMLHRVTLNNGTYCDVTYNHEFVVNGISVKYSSLKKGDQLETTDGLLEIQSLICLEKEEYVYDVLEVKNKDHSFYGNGIVSHNCDFLGSSSTLINGEALERLSHMIREPFKKFDKFDVWEAPQPNKIYAIGCDVAMGVGRDYSVIQVVDITNPIRFKQVAVFADDYIKTLDFTFKINEIGRIYNYAFCIVENNTYGAQICRDLWNDYEYEWLFFEKGKKEKGVNANRKTKVNSNAALKEYIEENRLVINDQKTLKELEGYIEITEDKYGCEGEESHDDRVDALRWVCYFSISDYWRDLEDFIREERGIVKGDFVELTIGKEEIFEPVIFNSGDDINRKEIDEDGLIWG